MRELNARSAVRILRGAREVGAVESPLVAYRSRTGESRGDAESRGPAHAHRLALWLCGDDRSNGTGNGSGQERIERFVFRMTNVEVDGTNAAGGSDIVLPEGPIVK